MENITQQFAQLQEEANGMVTAVGKGEEWIDKYGAAPTRETKKTRLSEHRRTLNRVVQAAQKRSSVAIFGQSQVGKSFLVRSMARSPQTGKLEILDTEKAEKIDFLQKINPPGGRESTGIITRFSTSSPGQTPAGFPFKLELLSQLDVAAIIINGYLEDLQDYAEEVTKEEIAQKVSAIKSEISGQNYPGVSVDEIRDFNDYLTIHFRDNYRIRDCKELGFFEDLVGLLPKLPQERRWELLHYFWGKNAFWTQIFKGISSTLQSLGFAKVVFVNTDAIINGKKQPQFGNTTNILDVERIKEMFYTQSLDKLPVQTSEGNQAQVGRSELTALIKELHLQIPNDFEAGGEKKLLAFADILDFPGSKSREKVPEAVFNSNNEKAKLSIYVRGKVAYLFYLYNRDMGISTLLYCMDNEPPLVSESPGLLGNWIKQYAGGDTPEARAKHQDKVMQLLRTNGVTTQVQHVSPLLFAMTKFNVELSGKGAAEVVGEPESHNAKWFARFQENFSTYMSKPVEDKWTENWTAKHDAFKFIFPIRDPGFSESFFEGYDPKNQQETRVRPEKEEILKDMEKSFNESEITQKFIFDREALWKELLTPNETGMNYLSRYLEPSSHPINMLAQLQNIAEQAKASIIDLLADECRSGNIDEDLKIARTKGAKSFAAILSLNNNFNSPLSQYLKQMVTTEIEVWRLLYDFKFTAREEDDDPELDHTEIKSFLGNLGIEFSEDLQVVKERLIDFFGVDEASLSEILQDQLGLSLEALLASNAKRPSVGEEFSELVLTHLSNKPAALKNEIFSTLFSEILKNNSRVHIKKQIIALIEQELKEGINKEKFNLIAGCIASMINQFVFSATWALAAEEHKPERLGQHIFSTQTELLDREAVNEPIAKSTVKRYMADFSMGVKELFVKNVEDEYGLGHDFDTQSNEEIVRIIDTVKSYG